MQHKGLKRKTTINKNKEKIKYKREQRRKKQTREEAYVEF
jgi:hypothetical protein